MKRWAFVSDFDGTISKKDFYWIVIEKYFQEGHSLFKQWKEGDIKDIDFLATVFKSINQNEDQIIADILQIPIDEYVPSFIRNVQKNGGDFFILSAGTDYYIQYVLNKYAVENVPVFSNQGFFHKNNIHMNIDDQHVHFSERYGIDKTKIIKQLKEEYEFVCFIGDSEPDSHPAVFSDMTFAIGTLQDLLKEKGITFIPVNNFKEVEKHLINMEIMT
ncbi:2,3-diketo-5-methylthio-1-phosphopentane phosphatase [Bacillus pakistanensis]|uniref:phosphoserine phosphatase n=1 Tax=Rossellomorea pakistanensis TaxID=992288 RepID=A0ABS2N863_9BACI|nr:MtnX-like HAD-IB family phosphatase [Bacillus pakistanensis]MBM7584024.1 2,3-diketo-5-methylthio-1-phosphopentane phosphatase [Bacillus pakistanensis]